ncbi:hypothetical protein EB061_12705 [bacterium]|nr:hypothetical protein [bacterium]
MEYLHWDQITITDFSDKAVADLYDRGYVFTRLGRGIMQQTRSVRIDLSEWKPTSENRRIMKKVGGVTLTTVKLPLALTPADSPASYHWSLGKLAKDFYEKKFGPGIFSAQKVKEMLTDAKTSNFNALLSYKAADKNAGYAICYQSSETATSKNSLLHYSYPFYDLTAVDDGSMTKDIGLGMMLLAIASAKDLGLEYIYLGSLQRPTDTYKLQFKGLEWFDGTAWRTDIDKAKEVIGGK